VSTSAVKWSEGLINKVLIIISRYIAQMKFAAYMAVLFITFFHILLVLFCKLCIFIVIFIYFYCYIYIFLLLYLCILIVRMFCLCFACV